MIRFSAVMGLTLSLLSFTFSAHAANTPVLLVLEHTQAGTTIQTKVEVKAGLIPSPDKDKPQIKWIMRAGDALKSQTQPGDRAVNFYMRNGNQLIPLLIVKVRYFLNSEGRWISQFQLNEEPLVARQGNRWVPLTTIQGLPSLIVQTGTALPNAQGYSAYLEFGFTSGAIPIDAWMVQ